MSEASFDATAPEKWLLERVIGSVRSGARTLHEIITAAGGADPAIVRDALDYAVSSGQLERAAAVLADAGVQWESDGIVEPSLPLAHPLDFEWRFSRRGAECLLEKVSKKNGGDLCLIASTTV